MNPEMFEQRPQLNERNKRLVKIMVNGMKVLAYQNGAKNVTYEEARAANEFLLLEEANKIVERYQKEGMK